MADALGLGPSALTGVVVRIHPSLLGDTVMNMCIARTIEKTKSPTLTVEFRLDKSWVNLKSDDWTYVTAGIWSPKKSWYGFKGKGT